MKETLKQFFTDAHDIASAMTTLLGDVSGMTLLEPSVGTGSLLKYLRGTPRHITAIDVDQNVLREATETYSRLPIEGIRMDFIHAFLDDLLTPSTPALRASYDAVLSNPPYGLYLSADLRAKLKRRFPELYVRESYGLFLVFSISLLRAKGRYVFLLPDTFLTSKNHTSLRRFLFKSAAPSTVIRFPSKRFGTVKFGYGSMCIIAGQRTDIEMSSALRWTEVRDDTTELLDTSGENTTSIRYETLKATIETGWRIDAPESSVESSGAWTTLGAIAECKTGIYTGDNSRFIGYDPARVTRRLNGHPLSDWGADVCTRDLSPDEKVEGLLSDPSYVQLVRGGHRPFAERTAWAIRWDAESVQFYKTNSKARLQNAKYYFRGGLAVPMVTSRRLSASLLNRAIFDQGVVGVFPIDHTQIPALLVFLNSNVASQLRNRLVNGGANNSANYLKRLPVPVMSTEHTERAEKIVSTAMEVGELSERTCDDFVQDVIATMPDSLSNPLVVASGSHRTLTTDHVASR